MCMEDNVLVNCSGFLGDFRNIYEMISVFRCSEYKEGSFGFMADRFMSRDLVLFI